MGSIGKVKSEQGFGGVQMDVRLNVLVQQITTSITIPISFLILNNIVNGNSISMSFYVFQNV